MIIIIHGDDIASSRKFYIEQRQKIASLVVFEGKKLTLTDLVQVFEGGGLFSDDKTVFIEELFSEKKESKEFDDIVSYLVKNSGNTVWIWENRDLSKVKNELFKKAVLKPFNFPKEIFTFLDSIRPDNQLQISLFHKVLQTTEPEVVFAMLVRQFRLVLALSDLSDERIDEVKRLAPWQLGKLKRQASLFSLDKLKTIYHKLFEIDLAQKTGANNSLSLSQSIDFFLLEI